jgi:hypothetical protein
MSTLTFNEQDHSYWMDGRRLPGVTETITRIAPYAFQVDEWYLQRGAAVHAAVALALRDELDPESVDERIHGRVQSVLSFLRDARLTTVLLETPLASSRYRFAGTLDYLGEDEGGGRILADWKGSLCPQVEPQMGAYALLLEETPHKSPDKAVAVETHDDGSYKCRWFTRRDLRLASQTFHAFLTARNWLDANKFKAPQK